eukprot:994569-Rhodomonas_salina.3
MLVLHSAWHLSHGLRQYWTARRERVGRYLLGTACHTHEVRFEPFFQVFVPGSRIGFVSTGQRAVVA